jgi:hypothetical protein
VPFLDSIGEYDPFLPHVVDKVPYLQVVGVRARDGRCSRSKRPVLAKSVRDEIFQVSKTFTELGHRDPRLNDHGQIDSRLQGLLRGLDNADPAPVRVKPMSIQVIHHAQSLIEPTNGVMQTAMDATYIGFYFLLRGGEYVKTQKNHPLLVRNVTFRTPDHRPLQAATARCSDIRSATSCAITFDTQKNRTKGETIGHGKTGHPSCPTETLKRLILHLRQSGAPSNIPLYSHFDGKNWIAIQSHAVIKILRSFV